MTPTSLDISRLSQYIEKFFDTGLPGGLLIRRIVLFDQVYQAVGRRLDDLYEAARAMQLVNCGRTGQHDAASRFSLFRLRERAEDER